MTKTSLILEIPPISDWKCKVCDITYIPARGYEPNFFHRWMQKMCFGFKWSKR